MFVEVLPCDIKGSRPIHARCCPVARAIRRQLGRSSGDRYIICDGGHVWFGDDIVELPSDVVAVLADFDDGVSRLRPFSFSLELPEHLTLEYVQGRMLRLVDASEEPRRPSPGLVSLRDVIEDAREQVKALPEAA